MPSTLPRMTNITYEQILHASRFGTFVRDPVQVVCEGMQAIAGGLRPSGTVTAILKELKLITKRRGQPTKLGKLFIYDLMDGSDFVSKLHIPKANDQIPTTTIEPQIQTNDGQTSFMHCSSCSFSKLNKRNQFLCTVYDSATLNMGKAGKSLCGFYNMKDSK
jgi:hypothetical protein